MVTPDKKSEKKRYVIYTRCSTDDQAQGDFTTLDAQAHHCKNMLDAFGHDLAKIGDKGIVNDDGYSGKDLNRPGIQMIIDNVRKKAAFDGIIFFRLDRLTRNTRDLYWLIDLFREKEIDFVSVRENLDSSTAIGRVVIGILGILSAFERELTGERVKASAIARVRQGRWVGGKLPYGYALIKDGDPLPNGRQPHKVVPDEKIAPYLKIIWEMAADNRSLTQIGVELQKRGLKTMNGKEWRRQVISRLIKNPFYKGFIQYSEEFHKGNHPAIVDEKLWERANKILIARLPGHNFVQKERYYEYLLAGIIRCGECGSHMVCNFSGGRGNKKFFYYECSRSKQALGCKAARISATTFDTAIINYFKRASKDQSLIIKAIGDAILESQVKLEKIDVDLIEKESKLSSFQDQTHKLLELAMGNTIAKGSTYKDKMNELETEIAKLEDEIDKLQAQKRVTTMNANSGEFLHKNIGFAMQYIEKAPPEAQKSLIQALIKDIFVYNDRIAINMYIEKPLEDILPSIIPPIKEKRPTEACKALVPTAPLSAVSDSCQHWLPALDVRQTTESQQEVLLSIKLFIRRKKGNLLSLDRPFELPPARPKRIYQNIIYEGLRLQSFIKNSPTRMTWAKASQELQISDSKIAHLLKIVNAMPPDFVETMKSCADETKLKIFNKRRLLRISRLKTEKERQAEINRLLPTV